MKYRLINSTLFLTLNLKENPEILVDPDNQEVTLFCSNEHDFLVLSNFPFPLNVKIMIKKPEKKNEKPKIIGNHRIESGILYVATEEIAQKVKSWAKEKGLSVAVDKTLAEDAIKKVEEIKPEVAVEDEKPTSYLKVAEALTKRGEVVVKVQLVDMIPSPKTNIYKTADFTGSITILSSRNLEDKLGSWFIVRGRIRNSKKFGKYIQATNWWEAEEFDIVEEFTLPRAELHLHTALSAMDALIKPEKLEEFARKSNMYAVAITDHGVVQAYPKVAEAFSSSPVKLIYGLEGYLDPTDSAVSALEKKLRPFHIVLLLKNQEGLYHLYKLVSRSHLENFRRRPLIKREWLDEVREHFIVSSACIDGEVLRAYLAGKRGEELLPFMNYYDYIEVHPPGHYKSFMKYEEAIEMIKHVIEVAENAGKIVVATSDAHYITPEEVTLRKIIQSFQGFKDWDDQCLLHIRTQSDWFKEFEFLDEETVKRIVFFNTKEIADMTEPVRPIVDKTYFPELENAEKELEELALATLHSLYGENPHPLIIERYNKEINAIKKYGFSSLYLIASKLVRKSYEDGYIVGSRGSVGSSFVAFLSKITEVNPLPAHWRCPNCKYTLFAHEEGIEAESGVDLPEKRCPKCSTLMIKDGHSIQFETFMGFEGDKVPDIDLNFSGEYQGRIQKYTEHLFGKGHVYRAGTISTVAEKTALSMCYKFRDEAYMDWDDAFIRFLANKIQGVKRTTGQHPGGLMIIPHGHEVYEFTPIQKPADDIKSDVITTHFDYHSISSKLLKLDLLGHDDPTVLKLLSDLTGVDVTQIPLSDPKVLEIFYSRKGLGLSKEDASADVATLGIPEFGTNFVMRMLEETRPKTFAELVRISGLSHGTDVWTGNAQELIRSGTATLKDVICARDDIMNFLINMGVDKKIAFEVMEKVRKGKGIPEKYMPALKKAKVPEWYIQSCQKIKYMFPKAHAAAYVMMAVRIAYFKVYYPLEFYCAYFSVRCKKFPYKEAIAGKEAVIRKIKNLESKRDRTATDQEELEALKISREMMARGFSFLKPHPNFSRAKLFSIEGNSLRIPFAAISGLGEKIAVKLEEARSMGDYVSWEDLKNRTGINKQAMNALKEACGEDTLPESNTISLFAS